MTHPDHDLADFAVLARLVRDRSGVDAAAPYPPGVAVPTLGE
ncbi:hypothetical protein [Nocardia otitidiscaviarum]|nr:hypothetical protein [Nocardia otitidiscaviarum]